MKVLAVETSGRIGSVCLCEDEEVLAERSFGPAPQHGRELVPCADALFRQLRWNPRSDVGLVAVSQGPGSYTGLRVGIAFVKTFAHAAGCAVVGVPSLDVLAQNALPAGLETQPAAWRVGVVVDAKRGQVYSAAYQRQGAGLERVGEMSLLTPAQVLERLERPALLVGDGLAAYPEQFVAEGIALADESLWTARSSGVARLGLAAFRAGGRSDALDLSPIYMRLPEAEEIRLKRLAKAKDDR